jgi:hypothetical protein
MLNDLEQTVIRTGWELFVLAWMPKHVHLFCRTPQPNFSKAMQYVLSGYLHLNPTRTNEAGSQGWQKDWGQKNQEAIQVPDSTVSFAKHLVARDARGEPAGK